jgi:hypothetical protein
MNDDLRNAIEEFERKMGEGDFWNDAEKAKQDVKRYEELKAELRRQEDVLKGNAIINIFTGAGGDGMYEPARSGSQCTIGLFSPGAVAW